MSFQTSRLHFLSIASKQQKHYTYHNHSIVTHPGLKAVKQRFLIQGSSNSGLTCLSLDGVHTWGKWKNQTQADTDTDVDSDTDADSDVPDADSHAD